MVKKRKLFQKILSSPKNIRFEEFITLLEAFGFEMARIRGSHHVFSHPDIETLLSIQSQKDGKAKPYQIRQFLKLIEENNLKLRED